MINEPTSLSKCLSTHVTSNKQTSFFLHLPAHQSNLTDCDPCQNRRLVFLQAVHRLSRHWFCLQLLESNNQHLRWQSQNNVPTEVCVHNTHISVLLVLTYRQYYCNCCCYCYYNYTTLTRAVIYLSLSMVKIILFQHLEIMVYVPRSSWRSQCFNLSVAFISLLQNLLMCLKKCTTNIFAKRCA